MKLLSTFIARGAFQLRNATWGRRQPQQRNCMQRGQSASCSVVSPCMRADRISILDIETIDPVPRRCKAILQVRPATMTAHRLGASGYLSFGEGPETV